MHEVQLLIELAGQGHPRFPPLQNAAGAAIISKDASGIGRKGIPPLSGAQSGQALHASQVLVSAHPQSSFGLLSMPASDFNE